MKYNSVNEIGVGDVVVYEGRSHLVLVNYIKGETDKQGYTPKTNRTILIDDMNRYVDTQFEQDFLDDCQNYWEEHFDDVVKDIKEYANSKFKKPMGDRNVN